MTDSTQTCIWTGFTYRSVQVCLLLSTMLKRSLWYVVQNKHSGDFETLAEIVRDNVIMAVQDAGRSNSNSLDLPIHVRFHFHGNSLPSAYKRTAIISSNRHATDRRTDRQTDRHRASFYNALHLQWSGLGAGGIKSGLTNVFISETSTRAFIDQDQ